MNLDKDHLCLLLVGVVSALSTMALIFGVPVSDVSVIGGATVTGLFAVIKGDRS